MNNLQKYNTIFRGQSSPFPAANPSDLVLTLIDGGINISWTDNSNNRAKTEIWVSVDGGGYAIIHTANKGVDTFNDFRLAEDLVSYKIRAKIGNIYSDFIIEESISMVGPELVDQNLWNDPGLAYWSAAAPGANWSGDGTKLTSNGGSGSLIRWSFWTANKTYKTVITVVKRSGKLKRSFDGTVLNYNDDATSGTLKTYYIPGIVGTYLISDLFDGDITTLSIKEVIKPPSSVLVLGNSITKHGLAAYWWGIWGMMASVKENDFVHKLQDRMRISDTDITVFGENIAAWEAAHTTYNLGLLKPLSQSLPRLVIIRLGENVNSLTNFDVSLQNLINYINTQFLFCDRIIITGSFFTSAAKDAILSSVAATNALTFVPLSQLEIPENLGNVGDIVYDVYLNSHVVDNVFVALHPNDSGMLAIANEIFDNI